MAPKEIYQVGLVYTMAQQRHLKKFCRVVGMTIADFCTQAVDNEMAEVLAQMTEEKRKAVQQLLDEKTKV